MQLRRKHDRHVPFPTVFQAFTHNFPSALHHTNSNVHGYFPDLCFPALFQIAVGY